MHDVDMAQNRVFGNAMEQQIDIRVRNAESPERGKANFQGSFSLSFPNPCAQALPRQNVPRHNFGLSRLFSIPVVPGSSIYVRLFLIIEIEEIEGSTK